jgi:hypothetical protein
MNCEWEDVTEPDEHGQRRVQCKRPTCRRLLNPTHHPHEKIHAPCREGTMYAKREWPGIVLAMHLEKLGAKQKAGCNCPAMIGQMNAWGCDGCLEHLEEIVEHLKAAYALTTFGERCKAVWSAITTGLALELDLADPIRSLAMLAIERARVTPPKNPS